MDCRLDVPAAELLKAVSAEIAELGRISERLQTILLIAFSVLSDRRSLLSDAQSCDALTQKLYATSNFLSTVAEGVPRDWELNLTEAISGIELSELALAYSLRPATIAVAPGSVELFEN